MSAARRVVTGEVTVTVVVMVCLVSREESPSG